MSPDTVLSVTSSPATSKACELPVTPFLVKTDPLSSRLPRAKTVRSIADCSQPLMRLLPPAVMVMLRAFTVSPAKSAPRTLISSVCSTRTSRDLVTTSSTVSQIVCTSGTCVTCLVVTSA